MRRIDKSKKNNQKKFSRKTRIMRVMRGGVRNNFGPINDWYDRKRRWFTLDDTTLFYYSDERRQNLKNIIELDSSPTKMYVSGENSTSDYVVIKQNSTDENSQMLKLSASTYSEKQELEKLFDALPARVVEYVPPPPPPPPPPSSQPRRWWWPSSPPRTGNPDNFQQSSRDDEGPEESTRGDDDLGSSSSDERSEPEFDQENPYEFFKELLRLSDDASEETISTEIKKKFDDTRSLREWNTLAERLNLINLSKDVLKSINQDKTREFLDLRVEIENHLKKNPIKISVDEAESLEEKRGNIVKDVARNEQQNDSQKTGWRETRTQLSDDLVDLIRQAELAEAKKTRDESKDTRNYYEILKIRTSANEDEVRRSYKRQMSEARKGGRDGGDEARLVKDAYDVLSNSYAKETYDHYRSRKSEEYARKMATNVLEAKQKEETNAKQKAAAEEEAWNEGYVQLRAYREENGNSLVPTGYKTADGYNLGQWVERQRQAYQRKEDGLSKLRVSRLEDLGMVWDAQATRGKAKKQDNVGVGGSRKKIKTYRKHRTRKHRNPKSHKKRKSSSRRKHRKTRR